MERADNSRELLAAILADPESVVVRVGQEWAHRDTHERWDVHTITMGGAVTLLPHRMGSVLTIPHTTLAKDFQPV